LQTAFLNFTPIIDHILRTKRWTSFLPPGAHTDGLLSTAGPKSELLRTNTFQWSDGQGKKDSDGDATADSDRGFPDGDNLFKTDDNAQRSSSCPLIKHPALSHSQDYRPFKELVFCWSCSVPTREQIEH
jgi:hypothetical protein